MLAIQKRTDRAHPQLAEGPQTLAEIGYVYVARRLSAQAANQMPIKPHYHGQGIADPEEAVDRNLLLDDDPREPIVPATHEALDAPQRPGVSSSG
jgi:hypothetical protein